jgi:hypothetical protein
MILRQRHMPFNESFFGDWAHGMTHDSMSGLHC